jgi:hypothetical protein
MCLSSLARCRKQDLHPAEKCSTLAGQPQTLERVSPMDRFVFNWAIGPTGGEIGGFDELVDGCQKVKIMGHNTVAVMGEQIRLFRCRGSSQKGPRAVVILSQSPSVVMATHDMM